MNGLQTNKAPSPSVVIPHFIYGALSFFAVALLFILGSNSFTGHYFQPKILAITHLAVLGWACMIIFGSLYQLLPVILETKLWSEKLAKVTFTLFGSGIILLTIGFWNFSTAILLPLGASVVFSSILMFCLNIWLTSRNTQGNNIESEFILTATFWLFLTALLGILMTFNFNYLFFDKPHLEYLKIHANMGIAGWFLCLIMGVGSRLIPMFLVAHKLNKKSLKLAFYGLNTGLILILAGWFFNWGQWPFYGGTLLLILSVVLFISFIYSAFKKRIRKKTDIGLKQSFVALGFLVIPVIAAILISLFREEKSGMLAKGSLIYGISIFLGFITALILGQTYKTLPFIIWIKSYGSIVGKTKTPLPKELYSEKIGRWQFAFYLIAFAVILWGTITSNGMLLKAGGLAFLLAAILYNINILKMMLHLKPKTDYHG